MLELRKLIGQRWTTYLFVKLMPTTVLDKTFPDWLHGLLEKSQVQPQALVLEIGEPIARENLTACKLLVQYLRTIGCGVSLNHFGKDNDSWYTFEE